MLFQMLGVFAEFERAIITSRIIAGQARARSKGVRFGRPALLTRSSKSVSEPPPSGIRISLVTLAVSILILASIADSR